MKYILYSLYWIAVGIPVIFWWQNNSTLFATPLQTQLIVYGLAKMAALVGFTMIILQLVLGARLHIIERWFGQDKIMRFHRTTGHLIYANRTRHDIAFKEDFDWPGEQGWLDVEKTWCTAIPSTH